VRPQPVAVGSRGEKAIASRGVETETGTIPRRMGVDLTEGVSDRSLLALQRCEWSRWFDSTRGGFQASSSGCESSEPWKSENSTLLPHASLRGTGIETRPQRRTLC